MAVRKSIKKPKIRRFWLRNPKTRVKKSAKIYSRSKAKRKLKRVLDEEGY